MAEDNAFEKVAEHLRTVSFALVAVTVILMLVLLQTPADDIESTNRDLQVLRSIYQEYGSLGSRAAVRDQFARRAAAAGQQNAPKAKRDLQRDHYVVRVPGIGAAQFTTLDFVINVAYTDGTSGFERSGLSGSSRGSWGDPINDNVLPDPTLVQLADCWERLDQGFEVIVPIGPPAGDLWSSGSDRSDLVTLPLGTETASTLRLLPRPPGITANPKNSSSAAWGFVGHDSDADRDWFIPIETQAVEVRPQFEALKTVKPATERPLGPFRTSFPKLFQHLGADADKPASQLLASIEAAAATARDGAEFELLGLKIKQQSLRSFGLAVLCAIQLYLVLLLRAAAKFDPAGMKRAWFPWLALYPDPLSRGFSSVILVVTPVVAIAIAWATDEAARQATLATIPILVVPVLAAWTAVALFRLWRTVDAARATASVAS